MALPSTVREAARRFGDVPALVAAAGWPMSYRDLDRCSDETAVGLARRGVRQGDVVALALAQSPEYVVAYLALAKLGAVTAGVNPRLAPAERDHLVQLARPRLVLATDDLVPGVPGVEVVHVDPAEHPGAVLGDLRAAGEAPPALGEDPGRVVAVVFTSGTTGTPRGAVFTNRQIDAIRRIDVGDAWGGGGPMLASTQFAHVGFTTKLDWYLRLGHTIVMLERWRAEDALRLVAEHRMPSIGAVPPQIALMLRVADFERHDLSCVRSIVVGAAPVTPGLVREAVERFGAPMSVRYSSTESGGVGTGTDLDAPVEETCETVGRPRRGVELAIRDGGGRALPAGEVGEICLRSGAVTQGYWHDPEATRRLFWEDGFLRTGDLGYLDDRGLLRVTGRIKEMYVRGGENVYPVEVEAALSEHPGVQAVAVVPRPDPVMGEVGVAVVVPRDASRPPSLESLRSFAATRIAAYKLPEDLRVVEALPLTAMEKIDRRALQRQVAP